MTQQLDSRLASGRRTDERPVLLFFTSRRSGPARKMASLVAWRGVSRKRLLRVVEIDIDRRPDLAATLDVDDVPMLVLVDGARVAGRLEGRATGPEIDRFLAASLAGDAEPPAAA
jgi:thioredoxin-like negative regulator of GroEL